LPFCTHCGEALTDVMRYCFRCGTAAPGVEPAQAQRLHLDDLLYNCRQCGREERYGSLQKCTLCHDATCEDCATLCATCGSTACTKCLLDCSECNKTGCSRCIALCETCRLRGLCGDHGLDCLDCGYPTCKTCTKHCKKCDLDVCAYCYEQAHAAGGR